MTFNDFFCGITENEITQVLKGGSGLENGKKRIIAFFTENRDRKARAEMLKNEYGIGGRSHAINFDGRSGLHYDGSGMKIYKEDAEKVLNWINVADRIGYLIEQGDYI